MNDKITYGTELQKLLIEILISDNNVFSISRTIVKPEYWDREFRTSVQTILDYAEKYKNIPTPEVIKAATGKEYKLITLDSGITEWFYDMIEKFCRHKSLEKVVLDGPSLLENGSYNELEDRTKASNLISLQKDLGTEYFKDPLDRLQSLKDKKNMVSTGWSTVDKILYGGLNRGELTILTASSGGGKSIMMQNVAVNWVLMGLNVIYISLELSENLVSLRMDAMFTGYSTKEVIKDIDNTALKLLTLKKEKSNYGVKPGILQIKKMPEAGTCVNDIRAYIKEFEIQTGKKVDGICVDYLDLLYPNSNRVDINNTFSKDKYTSEELRALAAELNILCVSASQLNRCLTLDTEVITVEKTRGIAQYKKKTKKLADIQIGDYVLGQNDFVEVVNVYNHGLQKVYKITTRDGRSVKCTSNHRFLTNKGLRSLDTGLEVGMTVKTFRKFKALYKSLLTKDRVFYRESAIKKIELVGTEEVMDIEVLSETNLFWANDILTHNSSTTTNDYDMSHIAGGISKINTADNVIAILSTEALRQNGEYQLQFLKTRSSSGVGSRLYLSYNQNSLRVFDKPEDLSKFDDTQSSQQMLMNKLAIAKEKKPDIANNSIIKTTEDTKPDVPDNDPRKELLKKLQNR
mgnify:FL=1